MNSLETLTTFFGWTVVLNIALLGLSTILVVTLRSSISRLHARLFALSEQDVSRAYFQYLAQYKIAVIVLSLVPYAALKLMA